MVDLGDPVIADHHHRARFVARVLAAGERARLAAAADPKQLLWTLFAAKEAAYKVLVKLGLEPGFAHRRLEVAADLASVRYGERAVAVEVARGASWVHVVATEPRRAVLAAVAPLDPGDDAGAAARRLLCAAAARALGCAPDGLSVLRPRVAGAWDGRGPPALWRDGARCDADVSLSHDGRFVAHAAWLAPA